MRKAFAYLRVSGKGQIDGDGFPRQAEAIRQYAKSQGIVVVQTFREEGVSGTKDWENRPALTALIEALYADGVKTVLIESLNRLARELMIQERFIDDLREKGFELISVTEPDLDSSDPTRVLMRQMMGAFSQYEKSMIVAKLRGARQRMKARTGRCEGRKPFGFAAGEQIAIERMKQLRADGLAFDKIAAQLNAEGVPTRTGQPWHGVVVNRILTGKRHDAKA